MNVSTLWKVVLQLPAEVLGVAVLSMLELQDCVRLDSAADKAGRKHLVEHVMKFFKYSAPKQILVYNHERSIVPLTWLHSRSVSGVRLSIRGSMERDFREMVSKYHSSISSLSAYSLKDEVLLEIAGDRSIAAMVKSLTLFGPIPAQLFDLPDQLTGLELLSLHNHSESEALCVRLISNNPHINTLELHDCPGEELVAAMLSLRGLLTLSCVGDALPLLVPPAAAAAPAALPLKKLCVQYSRVGDGLWFSWGLSKFLSRCPALQELSVTAPGMAEPVTTQLLVNVIQRCAHLKVLDCKYMKMNNAVLEALVIADSPLHTLGVLWGVTSIDVVMRGAQLLSRLVQVKFKSSKISYCSGEENVAQDASRRASLAAEALHAALRLMTGVRELALSGTVFETLPALAMGGSTALTSLSLNDISIAVDLDDCLCAIAERNPRLTHIKLFGDIAVEVGLSDVLLRTLAAHCPGLNTLILYKTPNKLFSDAGVVALAAGCRKLKHLSLPSAARLTDTSILALAQHCPQLRKLDFSSAAAVTQGALLQLLEGCRRLGKLTCPSHCATMLAVNSALISVKEMK